LDSKDRPASLNGICFCRREPCASPSYRTFTAT
jgi:hypothetical protein